MNPPIGPIIIAAPSASGVGEAPRSGIVPIATSWTAL